MQVKSEATPAPDGVAAGLALQFDQYQRSQGMLALPEGFVPESVTITVLEGDTVRATQRQARTLSPAGLRYSDSIRVATPLTEIRPQRPGVNHECSDRNRRPAGPAACSPGLYRLGGRQGQDLLAEGNPELKLRVFVQGGGCSGFQYGFTFDEVVNEDDTVLDKAGVQLLVDPMSFQYLVGAEIDYKEDIEGSQFVIRNPNASTTCGCGSSFSV